MLWLTLETVSSNFYQTLDDPLKCQFPLIERGFKAAQYSFQSALEIDFSLRCWSLLGELSLQVDQLKCSE